VAVEWTEGVKMKILNKNPAIGYVLLHIPIVKDNKFKIAPASTNGKVIIVNDDFIDKIIERTGVDSKKFRTRLLAHEVLHIILKHEDRFATLESTNKVCWNVAGDVVINSLMLKEVEGTTDGEANLTNLQKKNLLAEFSVERLETEKVYMALLDSENKKTGTQGMAGTGQGKKGGEGRGKSKSGKGKNKGKGKDDEKQKSKREKLKSLPNYMPDLTDVETERDKELSENARNEGFADTKNYVKSLLAQGLFVGKLAGKGKGDLFKILEGLIEKKRNWHGVLKNVVSQKVAENGHDITYSRPHRRFYSMPSFYQNGFIIPARLKTNLDKVVVAVDSSGSIDNEKYIKFGSDLLGLVKNFRMNGWLVFFDDGIGRKYPLHRLNKMSVSNIFRDRTNGGTDLTEVFQFAERVRAKILLVFTDTEAHFPKQRRWGFRTMFLTYDKDYNKEAEKFGNVVILDFKEGERNE